MLVTIAIYVSPYYVCPGLVICLWAWIWPLKTITTRQWTHSLWLLFHSVVTFRHYMCHTGYHSHLCITICVYVLGWWFVYRHEFAPWKQPPPFGMQFMPTSTWCILGSPYMAYHWVMLNGMIKLTKSNSEKQSYLCKPVNKLACSHFHYYLYLSYILLQFI